VALTGALPSIYLQTCSAPQEFSIDRDGFFRMRLSDRLFFELIRGPRGTLDFADPDLDEFSTPAQKFVARLRFDTVPGACDLPPKFGRIPRGQQSRLAGFKTRPV